MLLDLESWRQRLADALPDVRVKIAETVAATALGIQEYPAVYVCNPSGRRVDVSGSQLRKDVDQTRVSMVFKFRRLGNQQGDKRLIQMTEAMKIARKTFTGWICPDAFASDEVRAVDYATNTINDEVLQGVLVLTVKTQI